MDNTLKKIEELREKKLRENNERLRDRVQYEMKDTMKFFDRKKAQGYSDKELLKDIEKYVSKQRSDND